MTASAFGWFLCAIALPVAAAPEGGPERTRLVVEALRAVPAGASMGSSAFAQVDAFFDFDAFAADCLGASASKFKPAERAEFQRRMAAIVRGAGYLSGGVSLRSADITYQEPRSRKGGTLVNISVRFPNEDAGATFGFLWGPNGRVVDLELDGVSLAADTRNQVARIVAKGGPAELLRRLDQRLRAIATPGR